ncbi:alpha-L-glutamate ligase [Nostocaceae cyanobacterium CENA369]|uniref:Alpha-L-glutamate ligase n=1 Tax=Dendronalium phyllosphericum CENA369 TaxID=1725256 RepID=A0A8J7I1W0_9NOST|nr:YheC/YheD family protein [Dendronalium phyllosphericum]MBH8574515.1 alpha-L-glutamate ligase [Dendronalium phyllosphericum CENA369]
MITNIRLVLAAAKELDLDFEILHPNQNLVKVVVNEKPYYFTNYSTPFLSQSISKIFKDKDYTYHLLKDTVNLPKTKAFLSPYCKEIYKEYLLYLDIDSMIGEIKATFNLPLIIKKNAGSAGNNVFLCQDINEVKLSLEQIFNVNSKEYDYVALAQEYIDIAREYRTIIFNNELLLLYEKSKFEAKFIGNLSPLHWEGAKAIHITDKKIIASIENFVRPIFQEFSVDYGGFDIAVDKNGKYWLIEINSHPNFDIFIRDNNETIIVEMFKKMLISFS